MPRIEPTDPAWLTRWGAWGLGAALLVLSGALLWLIWQEPGAVLLYPVFILGLGATGWLFQHPLASLLVALLGIAATLDYVDGLQLQEIAYGLYFYAFIGVWLMRRWLRQEAVLRQPEDYLLVLLLGGILLSIGMSWLFKGAFREAFGQQVALSLLLLYFPVKDACTRYRHGVLWINGVLVALLLFICVRNALNYQDALSNAAYAWQVLKGRVNTNDNILMAGSLFSLIWLLYVPRWWVRVGMAGLFLMSFTSLILTQSRGYWIAFAFGAFVLLLLLEPVRRKQLISFGVFTGLALFTLAYVFLGDLFLLVITGLFERLTSIGSSLTRDLSMVNRLLETEAALQQVAYNPILGYGAGTPFYFYDLTWEYTMGRSFVHNGYVGLWYRFGLWGLLLTLAWWLRSAWRGVQAYRNKAASFITRCTGLVAAVGLSGFLLSTLTSPPFYLTDTTFIFALLAGMGVGAYERAQCEAVHVGGGEG